MEITFYFHDAHIKKLFCIIENALRYALKKLELSINAFIEWRGSF